MAERLTGRDYGLLALFCLVLCSFPLLSGRTLTTHETVHCQNVREMRADGDWIIPHYGGRVWMERPPLPFWITLGVIQVFGDQQFSYRFAAFLMGVPVVLMLAWMGGVWYGRSVGLLTGFVLATMQEFTHYAAGPEADIFLCTIVTGALALFVHLEFQKRNVGHVSNLSDSPDRLETCPTTPAGESTAFVGARPWALLAFFFVLGMTNIVKGLFFGSIFVLLPIAGFLLSNLDWTAIRRYLWLPGWAAFLVAGAAWPVAAYLQFPDVIDFWKHDYLGRVNQGYMREPFWYYFAHLPVVVFPWTIPALVGLWLTRGAAFGAKGSPERFLWCWAVLPVLFFSIPQGKHHHYLLQCLAPWSVLGALGAVRIWERLTTGPAWLRQPAWSLLLTLPAAVALLALRAKVPGPAWLVPALVVACPVGLYLLGWAVTQRNGRIAVAGCCVAYLAFYWTAYGYRSTCLDRYQDDYAFVNQACGLVPADQRVLVMDDDAPLNASWLLFYVGERATLLHNATFLLDEKAAAPEVHLIARRKTEQELAALGTYEVVLSSARSRYERTPADRYVLFRFRPHAGLARHHDVRISPLQATGRAPGPYLSEHLEPTAEKSTWLTP